ncbi:hypothetical protein PIB30_036192 [Stylosanthes scabra]|uniref:Uncharacterized protein n=1 Tax=Stylosanthes scabra TaxID=79078 RepID=A0ABU6SDR4_9FABA|nr:hypothetical protein [Stylosanthes scabra]
MLQFICLPYRTLEVEAVLDQGILQEEHRALCLEGFRIVLTRPSTSTSCMRRTDAGMTSGFRTRFSADMHSWPPGMVFEVVQSADPGPAADFIQWWILVARRYLVPADRSHHLPPDKIPVEATKRQSGPHPARPDVPHVPDNRRPARRMMVGTRTTARDWQWLDNMMAEDAPVVPPTQKIRRMPESYARRRGAGRPRRGGRAGRGRGEGVTRRLPSRLRAVSAPVSR